MRIIDRFIEAYANVPPADRSRMTFAVGVGVWVAVVKDRLMEAEGEIRRLREMEREIPGFSGADMISVFREEINMLQANDPDAPGALIFGRPLIVDRALGPDVIEVRS